MINATDIFNPPKNINELSKKLDSIFFGANHSTFFDAALADGSDAIIGFIPIFGDVLQVPRINSALQDKSVMRGPKVALQGADVLIGAIPGIGDLLDIITVPNMASFVGDKVMKSPDSPLKMIGELPLPQVPDVTSGITTPRQLFNQFQQQQHTSQWEQSSRMFAKSRENATLGNPGEY